MFTNKKVLAVISIVVVALLATLGIDRIGGETWVTAAAKAEAGWRAEVRPYAVPPVPFLRDFFAPLMLVVTAVLLAGIGTALKWFSRPNDDVAPGKPQE